MLRFLIVAMVSLSVITACGMDNKKDNTPNPSPTATDKPMKNDLDKAGDDLKDGAGDAIKGAGDAVDGAGDAVKGAGNAVRDAGNGVKNMK